MFCFTTHYIHDTWASATGPSIQANKSFDWKLQKLAQRIPVLFISLSPQIICYSDGKLVNTPSTTKGRKSGSRHSHGYPYCNLVPSLSPHMREHRVLPKLFYSLHSSCLSYEASNISVLDIKPQTWSAAFLSQIESRVIFFTSDLQWPLP